ncbi:hypothetical protein TRIUR3_16642 [Triticum urartu]|uniref:Uncharacterized protein n=1 Tax=Triticum urartu TaxID=4572 RepID=M7ZJ07_TRIUA|nr:hypothetical protein TRIUR3_16642 [Triticum urartu]
MGSSTKNSFRKILIGFNPMNQTINIGKIPKDSNPSKSYANPFNQRSPHKGRGCRESAKHGGGNSSSKHGKARAPTTPWACSKAKERRGSCHSRGKSGAQGARRAATQDTDRGVVVGHLWWWSRGSTQTGPRWRSPSGAQAHRVGAPSGHAEEGARAREGGPCRGEARGSDGRRRRGHEVATASGGVMVAASRLDPTGSGRDGGGEATGEVVELEVGLGDMQGRWWLVSE